MTREELLEQLTATTTELQSEVTKSTNAMKDIYSDQSNFESHSPPNLEKYFYPTNPQMNFNGTGIPKDSPVGEKLNSIINQRSEYLNNLQSIESIVSKVNQSNNKEFNIDRSLFSAGLKILTAQLLTNIIKAIDGPPIRRPRHGMRVDIEEQEEARVKSYDMVTGKEIKDDKTMKWRCL